MQLRLRLFPPPKSLQSGTQDNVCAEGPLPATPCCLSWSRSSHLSPGPLSGSQLVSQFHGPPSPTHLAQPSLLCVNRIRAFPFESPARTFTVHDKSQSLCMTARAWIVRSLPVHSDSAHALESGQSFLSGSVTFPHLCQPGSPSCPSAASGSLGVSIKVASSERPPLTILSKWNSSAFHSAKLVHSLLSS